MAYVGTPSYWGNDTNTLASILAGESSTQAGQIAVADVIMNRANQNFSGYGNTAISQALAANQFQGQSAPTPQSLAIAQEMQDGTLPQEVPGALYYANPNVAGDAPWAAALNSSNSVDIGGNYFTSNTSGIPYSNSGAGAGTQGYGGASAMYGDTAGGGVMDPNSAASTVNTTISSADTVNLDPDLTGGDPSLTSGGVATGGASSGQQGNLTGDWEALGVQATSQGDAAIAAGDVQSAAVQSTTATSLSTTLWSNIEDFFVRAIVVLVGLVLIAGGVFMLGRSELKAA